MTCRSAHDLIRTDTVRAQQDDLSSPDMLVRVCDCPEPAPSDGGSQAGLRVMEVPGWCPATQCVQLREIPLRIQMSDAIH